MDKISSSPIVAPGEPNHVRHVCKPSVGCSMWVAWGGVDCRLRTSSMHMHMLIYRVSRTYSGVGRISVPRRSIFPWVFPGFPLVCVGREVQRCTPSSSRSGAGWVVPISLSTQEPTQTHTYTHTYSRAYIDAAHSRDAAEEHILGSALFLGGWRLGWLPFGMSPPGKGWEKR